MESRSVLVKRLRNLPIPVRRGVPLGRSARMTGCHEIRERGEPQSLSGSHSPRSEMERLGMFYIEWGRRFNRPLVTPLLIS